jgi:secondary thiamine-phosphate synthase enzyme
MVHHGTLSVLSKKRAHWLDITATVQSHIVASGIREGICTLCSLHTTAALTINENADDDVQSDFFAKLAQLLPQQDNYLHAEDNSDSHLKTSLVGLSVVVPIQKAVLVLGRWQSVYLCEFDGPRSRQIHCTLIGE